MLTEAALRLIGLVVALVAGTWAALLALGAANQAQSGFGEH